MQDLLGRPLKRANRASLTVPSLVLKLDTVVRVQNQAVKIAWTQ
jgi:hypothetical protein